MKNKTRFKRIYVEITNVCNLNCSFCPKTSRVHEFMSPVLFSKILHENKSLTHKFVLHLMGEPLLHPQFAELLSIADDEQVNVELTTNGTLLSDSMIEEILKHKSIIHVNFSLHSFEINSVLTLDEYLYQINMFINKAFLTRPELYMNLRFWSKSEHFERIINFFSTSLKFNFDIITGPLQMIEQKKNEIKLINRLYLNFEQEFIWPIKSNERQVAHSKSNQASKHGTCQALRSHIGVLVNGDVVPCCLDSEGKMVLGNLKKTTISCLLESSKRVQEMLSGFLSNKLTEEFCQKCNYILRFRK